MTMMPYDAILTLREAGHGVEVLEETHARSEDAVGMVTRADGVQPAAASPAIACALENDG